MLRDPPGRRGQQREKNGIQKREQLQGSWGQTGWSMNKEQLHAEVPEILKLGHLNIGDREIKILETLEI